jgi:hypothetical protein
MSPQNSTLGLMGGDFKSTFNRAGQRSGIYRPEDNAYISNYVDGIDNFFYTGDFTYASSPAPSYLSGIFIKPELDRLYACGGSTEDTNGSLSTDNSIYANVFGENGKLLTVTSPSLFKQPVSWVTGSFNNTLSWYPEPTGLSFKPDGTQVILCGNLVTNTVSNTITTRGTIIFQYSIPSGNAWDPTKINGYGVGQTFTFLGSNYVVYSVGPQFGPAPIKIYGSNSATSRIYDIFVHPDGTTFYYLMGGSNVSTLYQGSISSAWDIGNAGANLNTNTASLVIDPTLVNSFANIGYFSGIAFNPLGTKLYVISKTYGGTIFQYNLGTPWQINTATFKTSLYVGTYKSEIQGQSQGIIMLPDGETIFCAGLNGFTGKVYNYSILPY